MADDATIDTIKYDGFVARVLDGGRRVVLNKGARDGISHGDKFVVFRAEEEIHDPKTGESLGILEEIKGKGEVVHVQDHVCTIEPYEFDTRQVSEQPNHLIGGTIFSPSRTTRMEKVYRRFVDAQCGDYARRI